MTAPLKDAQIRDPLCDYFEEKYGTVRFFEELTMGRSRADIVLVTNDALIGVEIKSDADTYERLARQVKDYDRFFDFNYVVVGSTHALHVREHIPPYWGVISVERIGTRLDLYELAAPGPNKKVRLTNQLELLWRREWTALQAANRLHKYADRRRSFVKKYILASIPPEDLKRQVLEILRERDYSVFEKEGS
ncbi:MAG: sce7726 family protein [Lachnospiraceae bacterium]|nr:sce7726 family protein [Lachnospiraceae bacterium]